MSFAPWKLGVEIELVAPPGVSRRDLAERVAARSGGRVRRFFHPQSETSEVANTPLFENLTLGFAAVTPRGRPIAAFVDDLTLQHGLAKTATPKPGWYRVVADDARLLRLAMRHCDAEAAGDTVLDPLARLFGSTPQPQSNGMVRIVDDRGASVAICAPLPGERERPCEIVTAPMTRHRARALSDLLADARALGFTVPLEGATHLHFDAAPLASARAVAALVAVFSTYREELRALVGVNPHCVRLGPWPEALIARVAERDFAALDWPAALGVLRDLKPIKYCDFNLANIVSGDPAKHTFEVRILPAGLDPAPILAAAGLFEGMLRWCASAPSVHHLPPRLADMIAMLPITANARNAISALADGAPFMDSADASR